MHFGPREISRLTQLQKRSETSQESWSPYSFRTNYSVNSQRFVLEAALTFSMKKNTSEFKFAERNSALLQNNKVWKKSLPFVQLRGNHTVASPKEQLYERMTSNPALTEKKYTKSQRLSPRFSSEAKMFGHVSYSTELVRMCLACQHFDFNSADWISDNLHVISSWYLRTMGKEFILRFSRR